jgi:hypothetical protein
MAHADSEERGPELKERNDSTTNSAAEEDRTVRGGFVI